MQYIFESCSSAVKHACEDKSFGVYYSERRNADPTIHIHDCCEVFFCLSGGKNFLIGDRLYDVCDNDVFIINQFEAHKITYDSDKKFARFIFQISPDFIYDASTAHSDLSKCFYPHKSGFDHRIHLNEAQATKLKKSIKMLEEESGFGDDVVKRAVMAGILVDLNRAVISREGVDEDAPKHDAVSLAIDFINNNYENPITLETVAKASYLSVNQLCRLFSEYCGTTVAKYITSKRITEAKKMLASGKSVTETALQCGFGDYSGFIRVFKKNVGITPGKYKGEK